MNRHIIWGTFAAALLLILAVIIAQEKAGSNSLQHHLKPPQAASSITTNTTNLSQVVASSNRFGFKLFKSVQQQTSDENILISPSSIAIALAMTRHGTAQETLAEITTSLGLGRLNPQTIDPSYAKLIKTLQTADADVELAIANALWVNQNITLKPQFVRNAQDFYQAQVTNLDFNDSMAKDTINAWVAKNTANKIPQIVDSISPDDALYLINAIYFKGSWTNKFDPNATTNQPFYLNDRREKDVAMMSQTGDYRYYHHEQFQAIRLPYGEQGELGMYIFLPSQSSSLEQFNQSLNLDNWQEWLSQMRSQKGKIALPKFKLEFETELKEALASLGMKQIFNPAQADFSAMTDNPVAIDTVKHKAVIEVNEEGTEAAGVTSIGIRITSAMPEDPPFALNINRPFFLAIRDDISETILFMGNVNEPI